MEKVIGSCHFDEFYNIFRKIQIIYNPSLLASSAAFLFIFELALQEVKKKRV